MQGTEWKRIREFPGYLVHPSGEVCNEETGRVMQVTQNQSGVAMVGLNVDGTQYRRSLALLVATAFIPQLDGRHDTPIHLNGDPFDNDVENLMWRPRWFAIKYKRQFANVEDRQTHIPYPIRLRDDHTKEWDNSWDCARYNGLLESELVVAILNHSYVFPTYEFYETVPL